MKYHVQISPKGQFPKRFETDLALLKQNYAGKTITLTWEKYKKQRSEPQNSYLWGVCYKILSEHTGYTPQELHEVFKAKFIGTKKIKVGETTTESPISSTTLSTTDFMAFIADIQRTAAELGCYVPDPNEMEVGYK